VFVFRVLRPGARCAAPGRALCSSSMIKAFTKEPDSDEDDDGALPPLPIGGKNYMTPAGYARLRAELLSLIDEERPKVVEAVHWAARNGDRSENGDYIYGKKRLREIDRRMRFLTKRLEIAEVTDPAVHHGRDQVFFGATVTYAEDDGVTRTITILGIDESDSTRAEVSWIAPIARALLKGAGGRRGEFAHTFRPQGNRSAGGDIPGTGSLKGLNPAVAPGHWA
jgi:transcription elongation factor GreB